MAHGNLEIKILPVLFIFIFHLNVESFAENCFSSHFIILVLYYIIKIFIILFFKMLLEAYLLINRVIIQDNMNINILTCRCSEVVSLIGYSVEAYRTILLAYLSR